VRWLFSAYSLSFGCLLLAAGRAADAHGRRRLLLAGLATFAAAGAVTGLAQTPGMAIAGRALQGAGAAMMTPAALSLLTAGTRDGDDRRRVLASYGLAISAGFVAGTLVSGALATAASWRAAIGLTVALALAAAATAWRLPARAAGSGGRAHGTAGTFAVAALVATAALGAAWGRPGGLAIATAAAAALIVRAGRLGRGRPTAVACAAGLVVTGTGAGGILLLTLFLQDELGYTPLEAGLVFACFGAAALPGAAAASRIGARVAVTAGLAAQGACLVLAVPAAGSAAAIAAGVAGFGFGHVVGNASVAALATAGAPAAMHGALAGMLTTAQYLGGALGPALLGRAGFHAGMAAAGAAALAAAAAAWPALRSAR
jgi:hypothetical protein